MATFLTYGNARALEGSLGDFSYQSYLKAKILHALACQDQLRNNEAEPQTKSTAHPNCCYFRP
jgi:hypothetical protein